uniref:Saposin B-type domain-containing protein n=1 Tax=Plectus sambesii TaxID=2011161 RepID=A0A914UQG6_9BILA
MKFVVAFLAVVVCAMAMPHDVKDIHQKTILDGILCGGCQDLIKGGEKLGAGEVEKYVEDEVDSLCKVASFLAHECEKELDKLVSTLVQKIEDKVDPLTACKDVDLCKK